MKLVPLVETTHPTRELDQRYVWARPMTTEADFIAAAAAPGDVEVSSMMSIKVDCHLDARYCSMCKPESEAEFFDDLREEWAMFLSAYGVVWDPSIRL